MEKPKCNHEGCTRPRLSKGWRGKTQLFKSLCSFHTYWKDPEKSKMKWKNWRKRHPNYTSKRRFNRYKHQLRRYGLQEDDYNVIATKQNNKCAICQNDKVLLEIDHDHKTEKFRGLLCGSCNRGLSGFKDNINSLKKAIIYLKVN